MACAQGLRNAPKGHMFEERGKTLFAKEVKEKQVKKLMDNHNDIPMDEYDIPNENNVPDDAFATAFYELEAV